MAERIIKTEILDGDPHQTSAGSSGTAYSTGTRLVVYEIYDHTQEDIEEYDEKENGFYSYLDGIGDDGNFGESDDDGPYETADEAEKAARDYFEQSQAELE